MRGHGEKSEVPEQVLVLIVEDEILIAELVEHALVHGGYAVHRETTGARAIAALDGTKHFSGLVTDIRMPGRMTGWDVARHARRANPDIAVVYTGGDAGHAHRTEGVPSSTFVQKPFVPDQVTTAVSILLNETPR
jgi:CheY-like chemotaxis protein